MKEITQRQRQVIQALIDGFTTYKLIATHMGISWRSVRSHLYKVYRFLGVHNKNQVILWALDHGYKRSNLESQDGAGSGNGQ